ncbi:MAG TPA: polysaccharide deacetylase family protein [Steroidobacteraceae bacterium]|jgi:peptidoglycan/xylan/chitin deacetylase (PgdA/CDA1 family)|nr:polysaccharide deacetylase family protein [Steroidobacteraceae bacterium]
MLVRSCLAAISMAVLAAPAATAAPAPAEINWPAKGKNSAIVLTYDDALRSQLDIAVPQLAAANFPGTFFLDGDITPADMLRWRKVQSSGHELGNHSLFHPCPRAMLPERKNYFTDDYDVDRMLGEIAVMNNVLFGIDGAGARTYSVPCSQMRVGNTDYTQALRRSGLVKYARTGGDQWTGVVTDFARLDVFQVPSWGPIDGPSGAQLIEFVERVRAANGLGVLQFHGVGGDYLAVSAQAHQELVTYLRNHPDVWVGTFQEVMDYVSAHTR